MHDTPTPPPPDEPPSSQPPAPEHPHGVVDALREELEEVVEHVPQPVRWTVGKLVRVALLSVLALVVLAVFSTALYLGNRTKLVASELALLINQSLREHSDLVLHLQDIKGNPFTGFRIVNPRVDYRSGGTLLSAVEMQVHYSAIGLLRGDDHPIDVTVVCPVVRLDLGPKGDWRLPVWHGAAPRTTKGAPRELHFALHLRQAELHAPTPVGAVQGLSLDLAGSTGATTRLELTNMSYRSGPWHSTLQRLAASVHLDADSTRIRIQELRTGDLTLRMHAAWREGSSLKRIHAEVDRVRWGWLAEVFDNDPAQQDFSGILGLQLHTHNNDVTAQFKDIQIKVLDAKK